MLAVLKILVGALSVIVLGGGLYINSQRTAIIEKALYSAEETASNALGVPVKIGSVDVSNMDFFNLNDNSDVVVRDVEIFDKRNELLARVDEAKINFKVLALRNLFSLHYLSDLVSLRNDFIATLDKIKLNGATLNLKQRDDDMWNFNDIKTTSEGDSTFGAKIFLERGIVNASFDGKNISVEDIIAEADCADLNAIVATLNAKTLGANVKASGTVGSEKQIINAEVDKIFFDKVLPYLPADKIPEGVEILSGAAHDTTIHLLRRDDTLTYTGSTKVSGASVKIEQTNVEDINGNITFNERQIILDASATANGQHAAASGTIRLDTDETFFDVHAESDNFTPTAILSDIGIDGSASIRAHLVGTAKNPQVDAEIFSDRLGYDNLSAQNISTKLRYVGEMIYLSDASANVFGGHAEGTVEIKTSDRSFNAHIKANGIDAATLCELGGSPQIVDGRLSADIGVNGVAGDWEHMKIYGNAGAAAIDFNGMHVNEANASFYWRDNDLTLDYLNAKLPNRGTLGVEGTITDLNKLDLNFYGAHVDMTIAKKINDALDMSGLADFRGEIHGDKDNPDLTLHLSAIDLSEDSAQFAGRLFKQPYDSIQLVASGSLDGVNIETFNLERGGKLKWKVIEGNVGLTGDKNINLELETTQARAENIIELLAPEFELTGNVSNTVKITGTIDNPHVAGNVKFNRGSLFGVILVSSVSGDYFFEGDTLQLQNFEITSPMVDMVVDGSIHFPAPITEMISSGTISPSSMMMDFKVHGRDIRLERFKSKLPENYVATGHTTFEGNVTGTLEHPLYDGELTAEEIFLNGVLLTNVYGHIAGNGMNVYLKDFHFNDGDGQYQLQLGINLNDKTIGGEVDVKGADIAHMLTIADKKTDLVTGTLDSKISLSGTLDKPTGSLRGEILRGTFATYDIHDIKVGVSLLDNTVYVNQLEGKQGDKGTIKLLGTANLNGALDMNLTAREIALGMFTKAAGYNVDMVGTSNIDAKVGGTVDDLTGEVTLKATGGIKGSTFDLLRGQFTLKDRRVTVEELSVQRELSGKNYGASVKGYVPLKAVMTRTKENLPDDEQLNLTVSLDGADLSLLPILMNDHVTMGVGELKGSVVITGTAAHPQINGKISLNDGSVKVKEIKKLIEHINIATVFKGERFDVENFSGNIGEGIFTVKGGFNFPGLTISDYNFDISAVNLDIDSQAYRGLLNGHFTFNEHTFRHWKMPRLAGKMNFENCRFSVPNLSDEETTYPNILLDIAVNLGDKVHFYNSMYGFKIDTYLTGNMNLKGTLNKPQPSGVINFERRGTLTYLESVFNIQTGSVLFNQLGTFLPTVNFLADTKIDRTKITLKVDGPLNSKDLKFSLTSSPEMTETEIMRLLTLRKVYSETGENNVSAADALAIGLQMTILSDIENALKRSIGIDEFTVSRGTGSKFERRTTEERLNSDDKKDYNITIGKYINDKLMIRYTRGFGSHKLNRYGIQYDFNDNLGITIEREGKDYIFSFEARYKF